MNPSKYCEIHFSFRNFRNIQDFFMEFKRFYKAPAPAPRSSPRDPKQKKQKLNKKNIGVPTDFRHDVSVYESDSVEPRSRSGSNNKLLVIKRKCMLIMSHR